MRSTISIYGLYLFDNTLFDEFQIPERLDRENLIDNLVMELAELEVLYPDSKMMKSAIGLWSKKEKPVWEKLIDTTEYEYNPISNYDRTENQKEKTTRDLNTKTKTEEDMNRKGTDKVDSFTAGFNSENPAYSGTEESTLGSGAKTQGEANTDETGTIEREFELRNFGNIGVTTTQEMIQQEREIVQFNVSNVIIQEFKQRFCLMIY